jgi:hypothetical protein
MRVLAADLFLSDTMRQLDCPAPQQQLVSHATESSANQHDQDRQPEAQAEEVVDDARPLRRSAGAEHLKCAESDERRGAKSNGGGLFHDFQSIGLS